uniref:Uncharacterized protein n=1 Tax=viral metagenome TaxID=1070528 RepID=A0A6M3LNZ5_9ZZZZ
MEDTTWTIIKTAIQLLWKLSKGFTITLGLMGLSWIGFVLWIVLR